MSPDKNLVKQPKPVIVGEVVSYQEKYVEYCSISSYIILHSLLCPRKTAVSQVTAVYKCEFWNDILTAEIKNAISWLLIDAQLPSLAA